jgi:octaprenyl-diphosphate synthase
MHTATLLHDDVVDESDLRRGKIAARMLWGNEASVLVGDFLYSRAFEMMVEIDSMRVMQILARATNTIAEGEVLQLMNCHDADTSEAQYLSVIERKTAKLFEAASRLGAVLGQSDAATESRMADYGRHLGTAFQLIDDVLDYSGATDTIGKNVGDDLAEGKPTLPLIHAIRTGSPAQVAVVRKAIEEGGSGLIDEVMSAIRACGSIEYSSAQAADAAARAHAALEGIGDSIYTTALHALADFSVSRVA